MKEDLIVTFTAALRAVLWFWKLENGDYIRPGLVDYPVVSYDGVPFVSW